MGIGDWGLGPIPNPNIQFIFQALIFFNYIIINLEFLFFLFI